MQRIVDGTGGVFWVSTSWSCVEGLVGLKFTAKAGGRACVCGLMADGR